MTLDEAIKHSEKVAEEQEKEAKEWHENQVRKCELISFANMNYIHENECKKCAEEHKQLAEWLKDYKRLLEQEPVLEKIRAEIEGLAYSWCELPETVINDVLQIIDKYKESEG